MIVQQINLYQEKFREKRLLASAGQVSALLAVMLVGIAGWSYMARTERDNLELHKRQLRASQATISVELAAVNAQLSRQLADDSIPRQLESLSKEVHARKKVMRFVGNNQFGSGKGFSTYLSSLSNLQVNNVWLSEIAISNNSVKIKGSALGADLIPAYFTKFRNEAVFRGQRFQLFKLDRKPETDWKVDFTIATEEAINE